MKDKQIQMAQVRVIVTNGRRRRVRQYASWPAAWESLRLWVVFDQGIRDMNKFVFGV